MRENIEIRWFDVVNSNKAAFIALFYVSKNPQPEIRSGQPNITNLGWNFKYLIFTILPNELTDDDEILSRQQSLAKLFMFI